MHSLYAGRPEGCHQGMTTCRSIWKTESTVGKTEHRTQGCRAPIPVQLKENGMQKGVFEQKSEMILQSDAGGTGRRKCGAGNSGYYKGIRTVDPACSCSSFTLINRLFSSSSLSVLTVVSLAYLRL